MFDFDRLPDPAFAYRIPVPLGSKRWLNANDRLFWRVRSARTQAWRHETALLARASGIPRMKKAYVLIEFHFDDHRRRDAGNYAPTAKACVDGLVDAELFADDNRKIITGPDLRITEQQIPGLEVGLTIVIYPTEGMK